MVKKINTMVDRMNGVCMTDIAKTPGGFFTSRSFGGKNAGNHVYVRRISACFLVD